MAKLGEWARALRRDIYALYLASSDPRVPWYAKALAACVAAYALSPIDLIPDFIPVLGLLDEALLLPLGIMAAIRMIPVLVMAEHRAVAASRGEGFTSRAGAAAIIAIWMAAAAVAGWVAWQHFSY